MTLINIQAPQPVTEKVVGISFVDGKAQVDSATAHGRRALAYFRRRGYIIETSAPTEPAEAPSRGASKTDWIAYVTSEAADAKRLSTEQADALTRDQLADHVLGPKEA